MGKEIRIIKKDDHKKFEDYTFIDNNIELKKIVMKLIAILLLPITKSIESMYLS